MTSRALLALETSTEFCSAALGIGGEFRQRFEHAGQRHSQLLIPMVESLLAEAGLGVGALAGVAVAVGPGAFTGLRIAASVGQGIAFGAGLPVAAIGTLEAMAWGFGAQNTVVCADARMGEVYMAAYRRGVDGPETTVAPVVAAAADLPDLPPGAWDGIGVGFALYAAALGARWGGRVTVRDPDYRPQAWDVLSAAVARYPQGFTAAPETLIPVYVRDKVALTLAER